jgi:excisionase family DNA binding protein
LIEDARQPTARTSSRSKHTAPARLAAADRHRAPRRLAVSPAEAADLLGVSRDYFDEHVICELRVVRRGRRILVPLVELERWLDRNAARTNRRS